MELKDFISNTLLEIQEGVQIAIKISKERNFDGAINPKFVIQNDPRVADLGSHDGPSPEIVKDIHFDIAVTVSEGDKMGGNAGIKVMSMSIGAKGEQSNQISKVSRIQFVIPFAPPATLIEDFLFREEK